MLSKLTARKIPFLVLACMLVGASNLARAEVKPSKFCPTELESGDTPLTPKLIAGEPLTREIELKSVDDLEILYQLSSDNSGSRSKTKAA